MAGRSFFLFLLAALALLSGCTGVGQVKATGGATADLLPMPGATVEVGTITVDAEKQFDCDCDPAGLLSAALTAALKEEQLLWPGDNTPRFLFSAKIMDYEPGNAFKRWVLPGWGSTVLAVRGEIQTSDGSTTAAVLENRRSIPAGGVYTIGAWRYVFDSVASDLAQETKARINGGGFVVSLVPYSDQSSVAVHAGEPLEIEINNISDLRADKLRLGERTAAFGVKMGDIYPNRRISEYLTETVSDALRTMGHKVGSTPGGVRLQGELLKFQVETPATALYWDVTAEIELKLLVKGPMQDSITTRVYNSKKKERTYTWPSASLIEKAVGASVIDVMGQIQSDEIWSEFASGQIGTSMNK